MQTDELNGGVVPKEMSELEQRILRLLVNRRTNDPAGGWMGALAICTELEIPSGTIHPSLARLENGGWIESRRVEGSLPRRREYRAVGDRLPEARQKLAELAQAKPSKKRAGKTARRPGLAGA
jgi:PadR family transcriptional regulator, regulatory protein PadR